MATCRGVLRYLLTVLDEMMLLVTLCFFSLGWAIVFFRGLLSLEEGKCPGKGGGGGGGFQLYDLLQLDAP